MSFKIANNLLETQAFIVAVIGVALAILATILRFVATKRGGRKISWEDWFALLATVFFVLYVIPFLYLLVVMNGRDPLLLPADDIVKMTKAGYAMAAQFCMQQLFAKYSLLFLYYRIFWIKQSFVRCIYFVGAVQLIWSIVTYMLHYFECTPPQKLWNPRLPGHCLNAPAFLAGGESINSIVDFALVGLAIWIVQSLNMKLAAKLKLSGIFALGGLAGVLGFVKIGQDYVPMSAEKVALLGPIWATVQQACSVICCCAPVFKPLIPDFHLPQSLRSFGSRNFSWSIKPRTPPKVTEADLSTTPVDEVWKRPRHWVELDEMGAHESQTRLDSHTARRHED